MFLKCPQSLPIQVLKPKICRSIVHRARSTSSIAPTTPLDIQIWIQKLTSQPAVLSTEFLDLTRAAHLQQILPTRHNDPPPSLQDGDELPPAHHMTYFQPNTMQRDLAEDGSSPEYNAPLPYLRRMWAGGQMSWNPDKTLKLGSDVTQSVSVIKTEYKAGMIFVHQQRDLYNGIADLQDVAREGSWTVREIRTHVFRKEVLGKNKEVLQKAKSTNEVTNTLLNPEAITISYKFTATPPLLFRYSALTFNAHRIHYDLDWTREVEGHPNLLMHGPLTATLLVEVAVKAASKRGKRITEFRYRATSPLYVGQEVELRGRWVSGEMGKGAEELEMVAVQHGRIGMTATAS